MASNIGFNLAGREVVRPGPYAEVDVSKFNRSKAPVLKRLAIIAQAQGGAPSDWEVLTSADEAAQILRDGVGLELCDLAFNPSPDRAGAGEIHFYRVNKAVAASLTAFGDITLTLKPRYAGLFGNGFRAKRDVVDTTARRLTIDPGLADQAGPEVSPPLGPALKITYTGAGTPTAAIATASGQKTLTLSADAGEGLAIALGGAGVKTFQDLATYINGSNAWTAEVLYSHGLYDPANLADSTPAFTAGVATLDLGKTAQLLWLQGSRYVIGAAAAGAAANTGAGYLFFSGGGEGAAVTTQDYKDALTAAKSRDVQAVVVGSTDSAVQAAAAAHAVDASHPKSRKERVYFCGPALAGDLATAKTNALNLAKTLRSELVAVVGTPIKRPNTRTGATDTLSPNHVAAAVAGMYCGLQPSESLTWAAISAVGLGFTFSDADYEDFIKGGVIGVFKDDEDGTFKVERGISATADTGNLMLFTLKGVMIQHYLNRGIRQAVKPYVGAQADQIGAESILNAATSYLLSQVVSASNRNGVLGTLKGVRLVSEGSDIVAVDWEAEVPNEIAYIRSRASLEPFAIVLG